MLQSHRCRLGPINLPRQEIHAPVTNRAGRPLHRGGGERPLGHYFRATGGGFLVGHGRRQGGASVPAATTRCLLWARRLRRRFGGSLFQSGASVSKVILDKKVLI